MTKFTKNEKKSAGSDSNKQAFLIQKGVSRSGRTIKPKTIFGEPLIEIATSTKKTKEKVDSLKSVAKIVKPKPGKKEKLNTKGTPVKKKAPKSQNQPKNEPKFTTVDIETIIGTKTLIPTRENNCVVVKSPPQKKYSAVYEAREKEIEMLRARIKKLEALQKAERLAFQPNNVGEKKVQVIKKVTKSAMTSSAVSDDRPARVKKPTWKAIEAE